MLPIIAAYFNYRVVNSVIVLACWSLAEQTRLIRGFSSYGISSSFTCDPSSLDVINVHGLQGVLYFNYNNSELLNKTKYMHFAVWYKWLMVGDVVPEEVAYVRYDADVTFLPTKYLKQNVQFLDVYVHPKEGISIHPWAIWNPNLGLQLRYENERILRRNNFKKYPLKIAVPNGLYSSEHYDGTFEDYMLDDRTPALESANRCGYATSLLIAGALNATAVLIHTLYWNSLVDNASMIVQVSSGVADVGAGILRVRHERLPMLNFVTSAWPFRVGFTYIAERESSSNMYVEPFSTGVWLTFLGNALLLGLALMVTAKVPEERRNAFYTAVASSLQQDSDTVPIGGSGRAVFMTLSISTMLVHAYYTSAIVSALMQSGQGGPDSLRALGDSRFGIAAEDYDYVRLLFFDLKSNWSDMEYLKEKKMTSQLYQPIEVGVKMLATGNIAYHTEYNTLYPYLNVLGDDQICKMQHVDTIPQIMTYITSTKWSQYNNVLNAKGAWLHETGLSKRTISRWRAKPPPCRAALLAERVKLGDILPLLTITILGVVLSLIILFVEIFIYKLKSKRVLFGNA